MFDTYPLDVHVLRLDDTRFGRRRPRFERRLVDAIETDPFGGRRLYVAAESERPLVWTGVPRHVDLEVGDGVWALWFEAFIQGWGPTAKTECADPTCERALLRLSAAGDGARMSQAGSRHFMVERAT